MDVRNCGRCGRLFNYIAGIPLCDSCRKEMDEKFKITKEYIRDNPCANMVEISEECDVSIKIIYQWIRDERLLFTKESPIGIDCELCGTKIKTGRYCDECKHKMKSQFESVYSNKSEVENKMRYLDRYIDNK